MQAMVVEHQKQELDKAALEQLAMQLSEGTKLETFEAAEHLAAHRLRQEEAAELRQVEMLAEQKREDDRMKLAQLEGQKKA